MSDEEETTLASDDVWAIRDADPDYNIYYLSDRLGSDSPRAEQRASVKAYMVASSGQARLRSAMAAMSNVMQQVDAVGWRAEADVEHYADCQRTERPTRSPGDRTFDKHAQARLEWPRRVRAGVAALPKPGPAVYCQSEED